MKTKILSCVFQCLTEDRVVVITHTHVPEELIDVKGVGQHYCDYFLLLLSNIILGGSVTVILDETNTLTLALSWYTKMHHI